MFDLEPGTVLNGRYTIERYIEYNGSMLLYSAEDSKTLARVLLWEFYPCDSAFRKDGGRDIVFYWKERDGRIPDDIKRHCLAMTGSSGKIMDPDRELPPEETPGDKKEPPVPVPGPTPAADDPAKKSGSSDKTHKTYADPKEFSFVKNVLILGLAVLLFQVVCIFLSSLFHR